MKNEQLSHKTESHKYCVFETKQQQQQQPHKHTSTHDDTNMS